MEAALVRRGLLFIGKPPRRTCTLSLVCLIFIFCFWLLSNSVLVFNVLLFIFVKVHCQLFVVGGGEKVKENNTLVKSCNLRNFTCILVIFLWYSMRISLLSHKYKLWHTFSVSRCYLYSNKLLMISLEIKVFLIL